MKILVIENQMKEPEYVEELRDQSLVDTVKYITNGVDAIKMLRMEQFDAIVMELVLPGVDGFEVMKVNQLEKLQKNAKIFVTTFASSDPSIMKSFEYGAYHYMIKPINTEILVDRVIKSYNPGMVNLYIPSPKQKNDLSNDEVLETIIGDIFHRIGVGAGLKGYTYAKEAVKMYIVDPIGCSSGITKVVYPRIAKKYKTTPSRVERAIRHSIEKAWSIGSMKVIDEIFGSTVSCMKGKPTNMEFISEICEYIKVNNR